MLKNIKIPTFGQSETPDEDHQLLAELTASSHAILKVAERQERQARSRLRTIANEMNFTPSDTTLTVTPCSQGIVRITYIAGYCANAGTLNLGGSAVVINGKLSGTPRFQIGTPAGLFTMVLGDGDGGGLLLKGTEPRILINSGAAGLMSLLLTGEIVPDEMEY